MDSGDAEEVDMRRERGAAAAGMFLGLCRTHMHLKMENVDDVAIRRRKLRHLQRRREASRLPRLDTMMHRRPQLGANQPSDLSL